MPHGIIAGMTLSGKTHLAKTLAQGALNRGAGVCVLHKPREEWPLVGDALFQTEDPELFLRVVRGARSCICFVEMTDARYSDGNPIDKNDVRFHALATDSRHEGHEVFFLCQRPVALDPSIRENVSRLFLFRVGDMSASRLAEEFSDPALLRAPTLERYHYLEKPDTFTPSILRGPIQQIKYKTA
jgi:hypothetical protein